MKCPMCALEGRTVEMTRMEGLPSYLKVSNIARQHPLRVVQKFAVQKAMEFETAIENSVYYYRCPKCRNVQIFEK